MQGYQMVSSDQVYITIHYSSMVADKPEVIQMFNFLMLNEYLQARHEI